MENKKSHIIPPREKLEKNFTVPTGYFEQNAIQLKQIAKSKTEETKIFSLKPMVAWLSVAATVSLILFGVIQRNTNSNVDLTDDDLYDLVEVGYLSFDSDYLLDQLDEDDLAWFDVDPTDAQEYLEESDLYYLEENLIYTDY